MSLGSSARPRCKICRCLQFYVYVVTVADIYMCMTEARRDGLGSARRSEVMVC